MKALEVRGWVLALDPRRGCTASLFDESIALSIFEPAKRSAYEPTAAEIKRKNETGQSWYRQYQYKPTGRLTLAADRDQYSWSASISDTTNKPLETRLNKFVIEASRLAWRNHQRASERAREEAAHQRAAAERKAIARRAKNRRKTIVALQLEAQQHDQAESIRRYRNAICGRFKGPEVKTWSTWAAAVADRLDPVVNGHLNIAEIEHAMAVDQKESGDSGFGDDGSFDGW